MPPRHSKSETVGAFIERYMGQNPDHEVMYTCYGSQLATERSRKIRNYVRTSKTFRKFFPTFRLAADQKKVTEWKTAEDGGFLASGVDGSLTGKGAHLLIVDDPIKGRKQAESGKIRQMVIDWFKGDAFTRLAPNARIIIIQTRWHTEDLTGWLLENRQDPEFGAFNWKVVSLPAIAEPTAEEADPLGRQEGEGLWPERFPSERYNGIRKLVGEYDWAAQFQQRPYLKGGNVFSDAPAEYPNVYTPQALRSLGARITVVCDQGASDSSTADFTTIEVAAHWGTGVEHRMDIIDVRRGQWDLDELLEQTLAVQKTWGVEVAIECVMNQVAVVKYLEKRGLRTNRLNPRTMGDKYTRALPASAAWNRGAIRVPKAEHVQWDRAAFVTEHARFTGTDKDKNDDQVDTTAYNWLLGEVNERPKPNRAGTIGRASTTPTGTFGGTRRARPYTPSPGAARLGQRIRSPLARSVGEDRRTLRASPSCHG